MQQDAEGASKAIAIEVISAAVEDDAVEVGRAIARCNLLKCAIGGEDPNWGRVLAAVGTTSAVSSRTGWRWRSTASGSAGTAPRLTTGPRWTSAARDVTITVNLNAGDQTATV